MRENMKHPKGLPGNDHCAVLLLGRLRDIVMGSSGVQVNKNCVPSLGQHKPLKQLLNMLKLATQPKLASSPCSVPHPSPPNN